MTPTEMVAIIESLTHGARIPFAALTLAICVFNLIAIARSQDRGTERERGNYFPWLAAVFITAVILRIFLYPHHAGPMNDDLYQAQSARRMIDPAFNPINNFEKPTGWPFIISIFFWFTGPDQYTLFYANSIFGCLSAIVMFFLVYGVTGRAAAGIAAAAFLSFHPLHSIWSICGASIVPSVFFMLLSLAALFWFFRLQKHFYILLSMYAASFAAQISSENLLIFVFIPSAIFFLRRDLFYIRKVTVNQVLPMLLAVPNALRELLVMMSTGVPAGDVSGAAYGYETSVGNLMDNLSAEISRVTAGGGFSLILIGFAAAGLILGWKKYGKAIVFFALLGAAYLVLISSSREPVVYRERFFLYADMCLIVIGSFSVKAVIEKFSAFRLPALILSILIPVVFTAGHHIRNLDGENEYFHYGRAMTEMIEKIKTELPADAVLIVEDPAPFQAVTNVTAITPEMALAQGVELLNSGNIYFLMDISARETLPIFFESFRFEIERPMLVEHVDYPGSLKSGLHRVTALNLDPHPFPNAEKE